MNELRKDNLVRCARPDKQQTLGDIYKYQIEDAAVNPSGWVDRMEHEATRLKILTYNWGASWGPRGASVVPSEPGLLRLDEVTCYVA